MPRGTKPNGTGKGRPKTPEQIQRSNLARTLGKLKHQVADKEELWLEVLLELIPLVKRDEERLSYGDVELAGLLADKVLETYEQRWGLIE